MATGVPYVINFTDPTVPGKESFVIQPGTTDGPLSPISSSPDSSATQIHTSIVLAGMGLVQYGGRNAMTFLHMLEHFASATPPVAPTIGQIWYDYGNAVCKVWSGSAWSYVGSPWYYIASTDEYNAMVSLLNEIMGPATGTTAATAFGYGQALLPTLAENVRPQPSDWTTLYNAMVTCGAHQGTSTANLPVTDFRVYSDPTVQTYGIATLLNTYQIYLSVMNTLYANRFSVAPSTLETSIPAGATSSRTTQWNTTIQQQIVYTFANDAAMRAYFNAGGSITVTPSINSGSGTANAAWLALFNGMGTATLSATGTSVSGTMVADTGLGQYTSNPSFHGTAPGIVAGGFYELYTAGDGVTVPLLYVGLGGSVAASNGVTGFWLYGAKSTANGTLTLTVNLENGYISGSTLEDSIGVVGSSANPSTTMVSQTLTMPTNVQLNNPALEYPVATATILLSQNGYTTDA